MTLWSEINELFFRFIEKDRNFFSYYNLDEEESLKLANERANEMLIEACSEIVKYSLSSELKKFLNYDVELQQFNIELQPEEKQLIADWQFERYLFRDISRLTVSNLDYTPKGWNVPNVANNRNSFMSLYQFIRTQNRNSIDKYQSKDAITGEMIGIDYASYDE